jgi:DNA repair protein RadC
LVDDRKGEERSDELRDSARPPVEVAPPVSGSGRPTPGALPADTLTWRDLLGIVLGQQTVRRWFPRYPRRPAHFFNADGKPHYFGHRERLRQRFLATWPDGLPDYELLELVLFNAVPRVDVKPLAKTLLETFGSFNAVVSAPEARLLRITGVDQKVIVQLRLVEATARRFARGSITDRCVVSSWTDVIAYCRTAMAYRDVEHVRVLYLDQKNRLILDEELWRGTVNAAPTYPREIVRRALELSAVSLILVHNHPSGDTEPSDADVSMTRAVRNACEATGIRLHDHVVIGSGSEVSFRARRLI